MIRFKSSKLACLLLLSSAVAAGGCSASGTQRLDTATAGVEQTRSELAVGATRVDAVIAALEAFNPTEAEGEESEPDLKRAFDKYRSELKRLESTANKVRSRRAAMEARIQDHIDKWGEELQQMTSDRAQSISGQRRSELEAALGKLVAELDELKAAYEPFVSNLRDIELLLANDLSVGGMRAAELMITDARNQAESVRKEIDDANEALAAAISDFER